MNTRKYFIALLSLAMLPSLACGLFGNLLNQAVGGDSNLHVVSTLWSDVPPMDGLQPSQMDMPLPIKLLMRTILGNLGRLNPQGQDQSTGNIDWIVFTTSKTPADVQNFYTNDRMTAAGWDASNQSTCVNGADQGYPQVGVFCVFSKQQDGKDIALAIIASQDNQTQQTNVFYLRLEGFPTPVPTQ